VLDFVLLSAIVLQAATVDVLPARIRLIHDEARLQEICRAQWKLNGCTFITGNRLLPSCANSNEGWRINASARFMPIAYILGSGVMPHENDHIDDIRQAAQQYLAELEQTVFPTVEVCQEAAGLARSGFEDRIRQFARDSQVRRHPPSTLRFLSMVPAR
jgi:hypothetical protein